MKRAKILARLPSGFVYSTVWCFSFHWKKNYLFLIKIELCEKKWNWMKNWNFQEKIHFSWNFKNTPKMVKKSAIFSKKSKTLFCFKITFVCRKLISKLVSRSSQSTLCVYEAWNAPKSNPTLLARLKAQKCTFSCKISRILDFQNWKLARLKPVH